MRVEILYGKAGLSVAIPPSIEVDIIRKPQMPLLSNPRKSVAAAFAQPIGSTSLANLAREAKTACVLVCDITRPVPNHLFLEPLIQSLISNGLTLQNITILIATGLHRPNLDEELISVIGSRSLADRVRIENHFATDDDTHVSIGTTTRGTPVLLDRRFVDADLKIATGLVEPHFMAGYSGGRKVVAPGIAHANTIRRLHSSKILRDPATRSCNLIDNPLHMEQLEILQLLRNYCGREIFAVNTVIDEERRLGLVNFGEIEASHTQAVEFAQSYLSIPIKRKYHNILTSAGGYPLDQTYYQTVKGMVTPLEIAELNANIVVASECSEGLGSSAYAAAQRRFLHQGPESFLEDISEKSMADIDEWETEMQVRTQNVVNVQLYAPNLAADQAYLTGVDRIDSIEETLLHNVKSSPDSRLAVIPEGPYVIPTHTAIN